MPSAMNLAGCFGLRSKKKKDKYKAPLSPDHARKQRDGGHDTTSNGNIIISESTLGDNDRKAISSASSGLELDSNKVDHNSTISDIPAPSINDDKEQTNPNTEETELIPNNDAERNNSIRLNNSEQMSGIVETDSRVIDISPIEVKDGQRDSNQITRDVLNERPSSNGVYTTDDRLSSDETDRAAVLTNGVVEPTKRNGEWFLQVVGRAENQLKDLCDVTQNDLKIHDQIPDEVGGQMRAAIGKSQLLVNKKFKQFRGLCDKNLNQDPDEQFATTSMDLVGFWDMVQIQVDEVQDNFSDIDKIRKNNWKPIEKVIVENGMTTPIKLNGNINSDGDLVDAELKESSDNNGTPNRKTGNRTPKKTPNKSPSSGTPSKLAAQREEARKRLMAAKQAMKERRNSESEDMIFVTTN